MSPGLFLLYAFILYVLIGLVLGAAFVSVGVRQVMPASFTLGARLLLLPASVALWPYVLIRWRKARGAR